MRSTIREVVQRVFVWYQSQQSKQQTTTNLAKLTTPRGLCPSPRTDAFIAARPPQPATSPTQTHISPAMSTTPRPRAITPHRIFNRTVGQHSWCSLDLPCHGGRCQMPSSVHSSFLSDHQVHFIPAFLEFQVAGLSDLHPHQPMPVSQQTWTFHFISFLLSLSTRVDSFLHHT